MYVHDGLVDTGITAPLPSSRRVGGIGGDHLPTALAPPNTPAYRALGSARGLAGG